MKLAPLRARVLSGGVVAALAAAAVVFASSAPAVAPAPVVLRTSTVARDSACGRVRRGPFAYGWPIRPFDRQHPIRGFFGDPRTDAEGSLGDDAEGTPGSFSFHNGVDIVASPGTRVYPVVSGVVSGMYYRDELTVASRGNRKFQYYHLAPEVTIGEHVVAGRTVLGRVKRVFGHVHLTEIDQDRTVDPLAPGHLEPYRDRTAPRVNALVFRDAHRRQLDPERLAGRVWIDADAADEPPLPVPGSWLGMPVTPAFVAWRLTRLDGRVVEPSQVVADFRRTEPDNRDFWRVYAPGTYQNFPVFGSTLHWRTPGRYLFALTPRGLDTGRLANGPYRLTVDVADVCGNRASLTERIAVANV